MQNSTPPIHILSRASIYLLLTLLAFLALLPNLGVHEFKNEESLRTLVAYEMQANGNFIQPTYLGEEYFKKPPMYTWLTLISAKFTGWNELASRIPSVSSFLLTCIIIFLFVRSLTQNNRLAALSSLMYATTFEVLFFYGFVGEIDGTFTFAEFAALASLMLAFDKQKFVWLIASGLFTSFAFMLKGFPAFVFYGASLLVLFFWYKHYSLLKNPLLYISALLCFLFPTVWLLSNADPIASFSTLFIESASRTQESMNIGELVKHIALFPLDLLVKFLPGAVFLLLPLVIFIYRKQNKYFHANPQKVDAHIKLILLLCLINFFPYWISVGARVRYVLPLLPMLGIVAAYFLLRLGTPLLQKRFAQVVLVVIILRLVVGLAVIPLVMNQKDVTNSDKAIAMDLLASTNLQDKKLACDCSERKAVCLYINIEQQRLLKKSTITPDWEYLISCQKIDNLQLIKEYPAKKEPVLLYQRASNKPAIN